jgi:3-hydroxymyristoyl/3-hydroxydecanoyl-(acyl carrier protein) dehydratase
MASAEFSWSVPLDHPAFAGHFPGQPIVPGVVLLDQAILFAEKFLACAALNWQVGNAKFLSPVLPGEVLTYVFNQKPSGAIAFSVQAAGRSVASGSLTPPAVP